VIFVGFDASITLFPNIWGDCAKGKESSCVTLLVQKGWTMPDTAQMRKAIHTLTGILQQQQNRGDNGIILSEKHLDLLKDLPRAFSQMRPLPLPAATRTTDTDSPSVVSEPDSNEYLSRNIEHLVPEGQNKKERLNHLARLVKMDAKCQELGTLRETMVFATGNPEGRLMLIGEAPGAEEERQRKPFVGPAGQLLDKILEAMGMNRPEVYISNIVKFRPQVSGSSNTNTGNRKPHREEIDACLKYIMAEIDVVKPAVIIALGGTAATALLDCQAPVGKLREQSHSLKGIPVIVTYHPSYLLHCESNSPGKYKAEKRKVWNDMQSAMKKLGLSPQS